MKQLIIIFVVALLVGCTQVNNDSQISGEIPDAIWYTYTYNNINGGTFSPADFLGKPVLIESFAVWCPTCTAQQSNIKKLHEERDDVVSISLDTDPNEDEQLVRDHIEANGFDWNYAIAPAEVTRSLIDSFGVSVVNAPAAPVVLICPDGSSRLLKRGLKSVAELIEEIDGC